ncbi:DNA polymerase Y family protein [Paracoccus sp. R12_1]|uniref:Y-family DNA polymerase n=1 Tax=unclassified Paracoccus (in: a-proteobacteria) TaxID=2688777 RepID=UPI001ADB9CCB|nr:MULTISPECIES: DNA polymerase Y family protein [unclassified Paracoccus (in: a-proteobacteria)]MBO9453934.1 DNA polymerase Y family protein [Paracoccus sp. R12_2]MBO9485718.1 DNA polymerase Y family protein [Paracoccus sp. R12_1]
MFDGMNRRIICLWFPRLATERVLRTCPTDGPFALTLRHGNAERLYCLNPRAEAVGLCRDMSLADARAYCPDLLTGPARPDLDARFLGTLRRWAMRYCPWVGFEGRDGLVLDATGSTHLWGGEAALLDDLRGRAAQAGLTLRLGLAGTRGAAWALAHYAQGDEPLEALPVAALRLDGKTDIALQRLGLSRIGDLVATARAPLARRFGPDLLARLDQALGQMPEPVVPQPDPPRYALRMTLPEPIGLTRDVMGVTARLLDPLCARLGRDDMGARMLILSLRRIDRASHPITLRLAGPMRDPARILPLFERDIEAADAGFGIDQIRLEAAVVEPLTARQTGIDTKASGQDRLDDLITRIGTRIGLDNIQRFRPADSHIPEQAFFLVPATLSPPAAASAWTRPGLRPGLRPLRLFPPEPISASGRQPPARFRWRRMSFTAARATGPERIAPEWWAPNDGWRSGLRDYWKIDTREGRRLWLFHTPQHPGWFVQGEFA